MAVKVLANQPVAGGDVSIAISPTAGVRLSASFTQVPHTAGQPIVPAFVLSNEAAQALHAALAEIYANGTEPTRADYEHAHLLLDKLIDLKLGEAP